MVLELLLNIIVAGLCVATISWCWQLNKRIQILQDGRAELGELLKHFDESTKRAAESIVALQTASKKIGETIQSRVEKANYVADDLAFLIERAQKIHKGEDISQAPPRPRAPAFPEPEISPPPRRAEAPRAGGEEPLPPRSVGALQAMLEKLAARASREEDSRASRPQREPEVSAAEEKARARSRVEQELLEIIRASDKV